MEVTEGSNVIPFIAPPEPPRQPRTQLQCSFCKRKEAEVTKLISNESSTRHICDECVTHAKTRLTEES